eukprot:3942006-Rhodomonas_salina.2
MLQTFAQIARFRTEVASEDGSLRSMCFIAKKRLDDSKSMVSVLGLVLVLIDVRTSRHNPNTSGRSCEHRLTLFWTQVVPVGVQDVARAPQLAAQDGLSHHGAVEL